MRSATPLRLIPDQYLLPTGLRHRRRLDGVLDTSGDAPTFPVELTSFERRTLLLVPTGCHEEFQAYNGKVHLRLWGGTRLVSRWVKPRVPCLSEFCVQPRYKQLAIDDLSAEA